MGLTVAPLDVGRLTGEKSQLTPRKDFGVRYRAASVIWHVGGTKRKIIVDTSFGDAEECNRLHPALHAERGADQEIGRALARVGLVPEEIDVVVLTHLHWDHCQNNRLFPNARFLVQRTELRYAIAPITPVDAFTYESITIGMKPRWLDTPNIEVLDGDKEIEEGVMVIATPGHTPGYQSVVVETDEGKVVVAGCMVPTYENWADAGKGVYLPAGVYVNMEDYWRSLQRIHGTGGLVLPGHDAAVFCRKEYP
jgi:glyoxylase-like metal-dependent hydrolase (beta-lactamase superfamily II)